MSPYLLSRNSLILSLMACFCAVSSFHVVLLISPYSNFMKNLNNYINEFLILNKCWLYLVVYLMYENGMIKTLLRRQYIQCGVGECTVKRQQTGGLDFVRRATTMKNVDCQTYMERIVNHIWSRLSKVTWPIYLRKR